MWSIPPRRHRSLFACIALFSLPGPLTAQVWENRNRLLVDPHGPQAGALFGYASAVGDFDGDDYDDLAVSAAFRDITVSGSLEQEVGIVYLYRGGPLGLSGAVWYSLWYPAPGARFGFSMTAHDFDADGRDELAVGAPTRAAFSNPSLLGVGMVSYLDWDPGTQDFINFEYFAESCGCETDEAGDQFGWSVGAGDFDFDGYAELVVGSPFEDRGSPTAQNSGVVHVIPGSQFGPLDGVGFTTLWSEELAGLLGRQAFAQFGYSLATGLFNFDQYSDLAIGEPGRDLGGGLTSAGGVRIFYGSASGLDASQTLRLDASSTGAGAQIAERFGHTLAAADFNDPENLLLCLFGACIDDLAIGAPYHDTPSPAASSAGRFVEVPGTPDGLDPAAATVFTQSALGAVPETGDRFASRFATGKMDRRFGDELVIATPFEGIDANASQGNVLITFGGSSGVNSRPPAQIVDARPGFAVSPGHANDLLGWSIAVGDFDRDGNGDLAIGVIGYDAGGQTDSGAVQVVYGALFADSFERGGTSGWPLP